MLVLRITKNKIKCLCLRHEGEGDLAISHMRSSLAKCHGDINHN